MSDHISRPRMIRFCARALKADELAAAAKHLADCHACLGLYQEVFRERRNYAPVSFDLSPAGAASFEHLDYERLVLYVEERLPGEAREMVDGHLSRCARCRADVHSFIDHRRRDEPELSLRYTPGNTKPRMNRSFARYAASGSGRRVAYVFAVIAILLGVMISSAIFFERRESPEEAARSLTPAPDPAPSPTPPAGAPFPPEKGRGPQNDAGVKSHRAEVRPAGRPAARASTSESASTSEEMVLNDGGSLVRLDRSGNLSGIEDVPAATQRLVREALLAGDLERPEWLAEIVGGEGSLRGATREKLRFSLLSPGREVVAEDRPTFSWEPLEGATGYRVQVADTSGHQVADSRWLSGATTQWTPPAPLGRGIVYAWAVSASAGGEEVVSPEPPAPEMKFKVLESERKDDLDRLKKARSHLALGLFYARAGMLAEAERELQLLAADNPQSARVAGLLRAVRSWR